MHLLNLCQGELHTVSLTEVNEVVLNWQFLDREAKLGRPLHSAKQLCLRLAEIWFQWKWDKVCLLVYFLSCLPCRKSCRQRAPESGKDRLDLKNRVYLVRMLWGHDSPPPPLCLCRVIRQLCGSCPHSRLLSEWVIWNPLQEDGLASLSLLKQDSG